MATYTKINDFPEHLCHGVHVIGTHQLELALSNTAPASETNNPTADTNGVLANVTQIAYTNLNSPFNLTVSSEGQTGGTYTLVLNDFSIDCSGGAAAAFRYVYVFNDDPAVAPIDPLICVFDYGSSLTLQDGESLNVDFQANGGTTGNLFQIG